MEIKYDYIDVTPISGFDLGAVFDQERGQNRIRVGSFLFFFPFICFFLGKELPQIENQNYSSSAPN